MAGNGSGSPDFLPHWKGGKEGCLSIKSGKCAILSIAFRFDERYSELERREGRSALLAAEEFSPIEAFSEAQLSAFAPMHHASRNPYPRIAEIRDGEVWANAEAVQAPSTRRLAMPHAF